MSEKKDRRDFLKFSLLAGIAAAAGTGLTRAISGDTTNVAGKKALDLVTDDAAKDKETIEQLGKEIKKNKLELEKLKNK